MRCGYALRTVGFDPRAAVFGGIGVSCVTIVVMCPLGTLAGLMAMSEVTGAQQREVLNFTARSGFVGVAVGAHPPAGDYPRDCPVRRALPGRHQLELRRDMFCPGVTGKSRGVAIWATLPSKTGSPPPPAKLAVTQPNNPARGGVQSAPRSTPRQTPRTSAQA